MIFKNGKKADKQGIRVSSTIYQRTLVSRILTNSILALLMLFFVYLCFALTIVRFVPSSAGFVLTKNNTYSGSIVPAGDQALVSLGEEPVKDDLANNLKISIIPQSPSALIDIVAGPAGKVKWTDGLLLVDGKPIKGLEFPKDPEIDRLIDQYIGTCIKGDCEPGSPVIVGSDKILGIPVTQKDYSFDSNK